VKLGCESATPGERVSSDINAAVLSELANRQAHSAGGGTGIHEQRPQTRQEPGARQEPGESPACATCLSRRANRNTRASNTRHISRSGAICWWRPWGVRHKSGAAWTPIRAATVRERRRPRLIRVRGTRRRSWHHPARRRRTVWLPRHAVVSTAIVCCHGVPIACGSVDPGSSDSDGGWRKP
jgi:hypothetical protein